MIQVSFNRVKLNIPWIFFIEKIVSRSVPWKMLKMFVRDNQLKTMNSNSSHGSCFTTDCKQLSSCQLLHKKSLTYSCFGQTVTITTWSSLLLQQKQLVFLNKRLDAKCSMAVFVPFIEVDPQLSLFMPTNIFTKRL